MRFGPTLLVVLAAACASPGGPVGTRSEREIRTLPNGMVVERRIATIDRADVLAYGVTIEAPKRVARGEEFTVTVTTYGSGCIGKGDTASQVSGLVADVTPYDWEVVRLPPNTGCTVSVELHEHVATLRFDQAGDARVVIRGRRKPSGEVISVERRIEVR